MKRILCLLLVATFVAAAHAADVATLSFSVGDRGALPGTVKAGRTIEIDISAIATNSGVFRAILRPGRDDRQAFDNRDKPVKVVVAGSDTALSLLPPRFRAFEVTGAVAEAIKSGQGKVAFEVISLPGYRGDQTRLDVTCSVKPRNAIPPVTGLRAWHSGGQTFLTWREYDPPHTSDDMTVAQWKDLREKLDQDPREVRYRIYRSRTPISSDTIGQAELVDEIGPLSCWNPDFHGIYPKDDQKLSRYVVQSKTDPVPPGTGIYVHNPKQAGKAYYAVSLAINGEEDLSRFDEGNSTLQPVTETVGQGIPVFQRLETPGQFNYVKNVKLHYFVRWEAPPNCNMPSTPYDYLVGIPPDYHDPAPVGIHLHCWGANLNGGYGWWYNAGQGAVLLSTNQIPYDWWTGYHEHRGTWKSWSEGVVRDYTQRRLMSFLDWMNKRREVDLTRVFTAGSSMGGAGAPNFGIRWADRVAWCVSWVGVHTPAQSPQFKGSYENVYGRLEWQLPFQDGKTPAFTYFDDTWFLRQNPAADTPLICFSNGKNDGGIGWPQAREFWKALQDTHRPHVFIWGQAGHGQRALLPGPRPQERELGVDVRLDRTLPAFTNCSLDGNPGNGDPNDGDPEGQSNLYLYWDSSDEAIVDEAERWELTLRLANNAPQPQCTVDVTPRRCQKFKPAPGSKLAWTNTSLSDKAIAQSGEVIIDQWGLATVPRVLVATSGNRLALSVIKP